MLHVGLLSKPYGGGGVRRVVRPGKENEVEKIHPWRNGAYTGGKSRWNELKNDRCFWHLAESTFILNPLDRDIYIDREPDTMFLRHAGLSIREIVSKSLG